MNHSLQRCITLLCLVVFFGAVCPELRAAPTKAAPQKALAAKQTGAKTTAAPAKRQKPAPATTAKQQKARSATPAKQQKAVQPAAAPGAKAAGAKGSGNKAANATAAGKPTTEKPTATQKPVSAKTTAVAQKPTAAKTVVATKKLTGTQKPTAAKTGTASKKSTAVKTAAATKKTAKEIVPASNFKGAVLYNMTANKVVFARNQNRQVPPASLTKILAIFVAEDAIRSRKIPRSTKVTVSAKSAATGGSRMDLYKGQKVALDDLLRGMAISSGNDASVAVAEFIGGSEARFVTMMNKKARSIGMKSSTFKNCNGLPAKGQYTTAMDMLTLARRYMAAYPQNLDKFHKHNVFTYNNHYTGNANPLLGHFRGADGLKTGFVSAAGYNLIATAERDKVRTIGVMLGCPSSEARAKEAVALMEAGFGSLACPVPPPKAAKSGKTPKGGKAAPQKARTTRIAAARSVTLP